MRSQDGLTLIEVILTTVILAVGIVGVARPFLETVSRLGHLNDRLVAGRILRDKLGEIESVGSANNDNPNYNVADTVIVADKTYEFRTTARDSEINPRLKIVDFSLEWKSGTSTRQLIRETYVYFPPSKIQSPK